MESSFGKMPTTSWRRLIAPLRRLIVHGGGQFRNNGSYLIDDGPALGAGRLGTVIGEAVAMKADASRSLLLRAWAGSTCLTLPRP